LFEAAGFTVTKAEDDQARRDEIELHEPPRRPRPRSAAMRRTIDTPRGPMTAAAAARIAGISREAMRLRVKHGWPVSQLLDPRIGPSTPHAQRRIIDTPKGVMRLCDAVRASGISESVLRYRLKRGIPIDNLFDPSSPRRPNRSAR
jgi:hypothetical protein